MRLSLKNVGKIAQADIELNGITVIAGENDTGKSTISRALFCAFNSLYQKDQKVFRARRNSIERGLKNFLERILSKRSREISILRRREIRNKLGKKIEKFIDTILERRNLYLNNKNLLKDDILKFYLQNKSELEKENYEKVENLDLEELLDFPVETIFEFISISDEEIFLTLSQKKFEFEFHNQINNIDHPEKNAEIKLSIENKYICFLINNDELKNIKDSFNLNKEAIYIDDPFVLDVLGYQSIFSSDIFLNREIFGSSISFSHQECLKKKLKQKRTESILEEIVAKKKIFSIIERINEVCNGDMVEVVGNEYGYKRKNSDVVLDIKNISAGLKAFVILKTLLMNGSLEENGTLILDEPEIHLHPAWQLVFASVIVLIQKEFGMHILLNTHSPYFLNAIEVYAARHGIADKCKYYLAENSDKGAVFKDVSTSINVIYKKLARPFQDLENERYPND